MQSMQRRPEWPLYQGLGPTSIDVVVRDHDLCPRGLQYHRLIASKLVACSTRPCRFALTGGETSFFMWNARYYGAIVAMRAIPSTASTPRRTSLRWLRVDELRNPWSSHRWARSHPRLPRLEHLRGLWLGARRRNCGLCAVAPFRRSSTVCVILRARSDARAQVILFASQSMNERKSIGHLFGEFGIDVRLLRERPEPRVVGCRFASARF